MPDPTFLLLHWIIPRSVVGKLVVLSLDLALIYHLYQDCCWMAYLEVVVDFRMDCTADHQGIVVGNVAVVDHQGSDC